jgi:hypothetical protein
VIETVVPATPRILATAPSTPSGATGKPSTAITWSPATIPAASAHETSALHDPDAEVARSFITVTASATDRANPAPLLLITSPFVVDLLPGATISIDVPGIEAVTGRTTNWLSVDLIVLGDSTWLVPYSPAGAWFSDAGSAHPGHPGQSNQPG